MLALALLHIHVQRGSPEEPLIQVDEKLNASMCGVKRIMNAVLSASIYRLGTAGISGKLCENPCQRLTGHAGGI